MNQGEDGASAQVMARAVTVPVVFPGVPRGQILTPLSRRAHDTTQLPVINHGMKLDEQWVKTELTAEHRNQTPLTDDRVQTIDVLQIMPERLLDVEVAAGLGGRQGNLQMPGARRG